MLNNHRIIGLKDKSSFHLIQAHTSACQFRLSPHVQVATSNGGKGKALYNKTYKLETAE